MCWLSLMTLVLNFYCVFIYPKKLFSNVKNIYFMFVSKLHFIFIIINNNKLLSSSCSLKVIIEYVNNKNEMYLLFQLARAYDQFIIPLENFRKEHIGGVKVTHI